MRDNVVVDNPMFESNATPNESDIGALAPALEPQCTNLLL